MPFVQRIVEPIYLSRRNVSPEERDTLLTDYELETVTNNTLSNALRQLASLVLIANDIFEDLTKQLEDVRDRSTKLRTRIEVVGEKVVAFDPKTVTVPEGDMCAFAARPAQWAARQAPSTALFGPASRPAPVQRLYAAAGPSPVPAMRQLDRYRRDGSRSSRYFTCTPVLLGARRRRLRPRSELADIETSTPAALAELRRWTSSEALGDITVAPDCSRLRPADPAAPSGADPAPGDEADASASVDHRLPSPEEQAATVALRFPAETVPVDVSGRVFRRMTLLRRSLGSPAGGGGGGGGGGAGAAAGAEGARRGASGRRRPRSRRRNTIAGTDRRELHRAVAGESHDESGVEAPLSRSAFDDLAVPCSSSSDALRTKDDSPNDSKKSHFNSLKQWGKVKLKLIKSVGSSDGGSKASVASPEETNIYESVSAKGKKAADLKHERKAAAAAAGSSLPISTQSGAMSMAVKLRQRQARTGKDDVLHSSSGNWSASSESGRASIGSENTSTTHPPKSTTTLSSAATSSNSLNHHQPSSSVCSRRKFLNTSTSSSVSEGTLTPDIISDFVVPFADDGETSSIYSCDTEGYYTSFHLDSGLKTLKEEEINSTPQTPLHSSSALSNSPGRGNSTLTAENEYELFGKGSTSTTTSSAGTVCTTLMVSNNDSNLSLPRGPAVPERKSSLDQKSSDGGASSQTVVAVVHKQGGCEISESPDSGHNTSSSPVDSTSSPHGTLTGRSSEYEFSESDLEGVDRLERIRVKTTINSSRIPSMCVITPPPSDDETSLNHYVPSYRNKASVPLPCNREKTSLLETDFGPNIVHNHTIIENRGTVCDGRQFEKQASTDSERSSENDTVKTLTGSPQSGLLKYSSKSSTLENTPTRKYQDPQTRDKADSKCEEAVTNTTKTFYQRGSVLPQLNSVLDKVKEVLSSANTTKSQTGKEITAVTAVPTKENKSSVDTGDYVTIADVRDSRYSLPNSPIYSNNIKPSYTPPPPTRDMEYVSLNELPVSKNPTAAANILISPSNSLERKRRQGARVTLDSEGKVVYSSDSLKRNKASHTTFEPGPYVKETLNTPTASPLPAHRVPKAKIRPVTLSGQVRNTLLTSPSSPGPTSPVTSKVVSPTSPQLGKIIIKAGSRANPVSRVASPSPASAVVTPTVGRPMSPPSSRGAYVNIQSVEKPQQARCLSPGREALEAAAGTASNTDEDEEGKPSSCIQPPRYVEPPSVQNTARYQHANLQQNNGVYWTLPSRLHGGGSGMTALPNGPSRFNTIAPAHKGNEYDWQLRPSMPANSLYGTHSSSHKQPTYYTNNHYSKFQESTMNMQRQYRTPTPACIPSVPKSSAEINHINIQSSTPTKNSRGNFFMNMSATLSPIQKSPNQKSSPYHTNAGAHIHNVEKNFFGNSRVHPRPGNQVKSSMTAEELFTAIHKSKKKLNIKTDSDSYSRSASPSCSSVNSLSPGSSESSLSSARNSTPVNENMVLGIENVGRNRHSWSPSSSDLQNQNHSNPSPVTSPGSRQSWAGDRFGPVQPTSRNDFKRLLLQHGPKVVNGFAASGARVSAVEQLRLSRQQKQCLPPSNGPMNGAGYVSRSPAEKRLNGSKLLPLPRSAAAWRFASPRTDILSSTILEDCAEEEKASCSPQENMAQPVKLPPATECSHGNTLQNALSPRLYGPHHKMTDSQNQGIQLTKESSSNFQHSLSPNCKGQLSRIFNAAEHRDKPLLPSSPSYVPTKETSNNLQHSSSPKCKGQLSKSFNAAEQRETLLPSSPTYMLANNKNSGSLSPSNVKENMNTYQQYYGTYTDDTSKTSGSLLTNSQIANLRARQLFMQNTSALNNQQSTTTQPSSPRIQVLNSPKSNYYNSVGSPGRSILGPIDRRSPSKTTLETAL